MKFLTKTVLVSVLFATGFAQSAEPMKANEINLSDMQRDAQVYIAEHIRNFPLDGLSVKTEIFLADKPKTPNKNEKSLVVNNRVIAD